RELRRPVARMDVTAGARVDRLRVESAGEQVCGGGGTSVAPAEDRRQRPSMIVERKQAVTEARSSDGFHGVRAARLVDHVTDKGHDAVRVRLAGVFAPGSPALLGRLGEVLGSNR